MFKKHKTKTIKYLAAFLIIALLTPIISNLLIFKKEARAAMPVIETNPALVVPTPIIAVEQGITAGAGVVTAQATTANEVKEFALDTAAKFAARVALHIVVNKIIKWIQGGGQPRFVTDWRDYLIEAGNIGSGIFIEKFDLTALCDNFSDILRMSVGMPELYPPYYIRAQCTIEDIIRRQGAFINNFEGGWGAWYQFTRPQNNLLDSYIMARLEREADIEKQKEAAKAEAEAGAGFIGVRECLEYDEQENCIEYGKIVTPGRYLADATSKAGLSGIDWLINADEISEVIAGILNALISRIISEGLAGAEFDPEDHGGPYEQPDLDLCDRRPGLCADICDKYPELCEDGFPDGFPKPPEGCHLKCLTWDYSGERGEGRIRTCAEWGIVCD